MANEGDGWAGSGGHPWHLNEETEPILFLTNMGDQKSDIGFQVQADGVHYYLTDLNLRPRQTRAIDLRKLRDAQKEDLHGNVIPVGATDGSVLWIRADNVPVMGRLVVLKRRGGMASNYDCYMCPCPANFESLSVTPSSYNMLPGDTKALVAIQVKRDCNFVPYYIDVTTSAAWWSDSVGVATVSALGLVTAGQTGGSAHVLAPITAYSYVYIPYVGCRACTLYPSAGCTVNITKLTCGPSSGAQGDVTRGSTAYCKINDLPSGATVSNWKFTEGGNTVTDPSNTSSSWSGTGVVSGSVSVKATKGSVSPTLTNTLTVNPRNWHTNPANPAQVANGTFVTLPVPPQPSGPDAGLGYFRDITSDPGGPNPTTIGSGPNKGYGYFATQLSISTLFQYEINPDLENSSSVFSTKQYVACGFISWSNLLAQTRRHEYNSTTQSHHAFYKNSMNSPANNPGEFFEKQVAPPGANLSQFLADTVRPGLDSRYNQIFADGNVEPFEVNKSETGQFLGNINYAPYASCP